MKNRNREEIRDGGKRKMRGGELSRRAAAGALAAICLIAGTGEAQTVQAAPATPQVDETMYVNLDYYGKTSKINVVKG